MFIAMNICYDAAVIMALYTREAGRVEALQQMTAATLRASPQRDQCPNPASPLR